MTFRTLPTPHTSKMGAVLSALHYGLYTIFRYICMPIFAFLHTLAFIFTCGMWIMPFAMGSTAGDEYWMFGVPETMCCMAHNVSSRGQADAQLEQKRRRFGAGHWKQRGPKAQPATQDATASQ